MPALVADQFQVMDVHVRRWDNLERLRFALDKTPKRTKFIGHLADEIVGRRCSWALVPARGDAKRGGRSGKKRRAGASRETEEEREKREGRKKEKRGRKRRKR